jgi:hypothetical protein
MLRTITLSLLLLATARLTAADDKATSSPAVTSASAATSAPAATESSDATKHRPKKQSVGAQAADSKAAAAPASEAAQPGGDVKMSGMSILGNEDAPKSLVLVPWKSSQLADMPSVSRLLDSATQPVDKDVFMRELSYYQFKSGSSERSGSNEH